MEEDLRSSGAGLRGFKSHPRHHYGKINPGLMQAIFCMFRASFFGKSLFQLGLGLKTLANAKSYIERFIIKPTFTIKEAL